MGRECKQFKAAFDVSDGERSFSGYASVFNVLDAYGDVIVAGAFKQSLREAKKANDWPPMLSQHGGMIGGGDDVPIGVWAEIDEDDTGLRVKGVLADTPRGEEYYKLLKMQPRPAVTGMSIGYRPKEWAMGTKPDEPRRTLKKIELVEISLVTFPANKAARVSQVKSIRSAEMALRDAGFTAAEAKTILAEGFSGLPDDLRDAVDGAPSDGLRDAAGAEQLTAAIARAVTSLRS